MYQWVTDPPIDSDVERRLGLDLGFEDPTSAEEWLSDFHEELYEAGARQVRLVLDGEVVFGPMGLED
ncbi:MAG: hypothetical protein LBR32_04410 [Propionibacteriaceae bacterium]|nr:hypothetical protein [Propionibacteriaceae bacterium]